MSPSYVTATNRRVLSILAEALRADASTYERAPNTRGIAPRGTKKIKFFERTYETKNPGPPPRVALGALQWLRERFSSGF